MQPDVLAQLRDIHTPTVPAWWPPAPGWWLAAAIALLGVALLARYLLRYRQRQRPIRESQRLLAQLYQEYELGTRGSVSFVNDSNEVLKRLLVHTLSNRAARPASGEAWLEILDNYSATNDFTQGPGRILGNSRFQRTPPIDVPALHRALMELLQRISP